MEKIAMVKALDIFVDSVLSDSESLWPNVKTCIENNGFKIINQDEGSTILTAGLIALDTLHAFQTLDTNVAKSILKYVDHYLDYRINVLKYWPSIIKEMYACIVYIYLNQEKAYLKDPNPHPLKMPPFIASMTILQGIISGFESIADRNHFDPYSVELQVMFNEFFFSIILNSLGRWKDINEKYDVAWLF